MARISTLHVLRTDRKQFPLTWDTQDINHSSCALNAPSRRRNDSCRAESHETESGWTHRRNSQCALINANNPFMARRVRVAFARTRGARMTFFDFLRGSVLLSLVHEIAADEVTYRRNSLYRDDTGWCSAFFSS